MMSDSGLQHVASLLGSSVTHVQNLHACVLPSWTHQAHSSHRSVSTNKGGMPETLNRRFWLEPQALAKALQAGAAPELIVLDLRGNPLSDEAIAALVRHGL